MNEVMWTAFLDELEKIGADPIGQPMPMEQKPLPLQPFRQPTFTPSGTPMPPKGPGAVTPRGLGGTGAMGSSAFLNSVRGSLGQIPSDPVGFARR